MLAPSNMDAVGWCSKIKHEPRIKPLLRAAVRSASADDVQSSSTCDRRPRPPSAISRPGPPRQAGERITTKASMTDGR